MNTFMPWEIRYSTGNFIIDHQNRHFTQLISELAHVSQNVELIPCLVNTVFDEVRNYADYHFKIEEVLMEDVKYSEKEEHKALHKSFIHDLNLHKHELENGVICIDHVFCIFLKEWLMNHVTHDDHKIISEISNGNGVV
jgi:hemerythrin